MLTCPDCGTENPDGSVFCNTCGLRMAVSYSDTAYGGYPSFNETPYLEIDNYGQRHSYTKDAFMYRVVLIILLLVPLGTILLISGLIGTMPLGAVYSGLILLSFAGLLTMVNFASIYLYREKGRPLGRGAHECAPTAEEVMDIEDDSHDLPPGVAPHRESMSQRDRITPRR